jgi:hypothetical protein
VSVRVGPNASPPNRATEGTMKKKKYSIKSRNLFKPDATKAFKISHSQIEALRAH